MGPGRLQRLHRGGGTDGQHPPHTRSSSRSTTVSGCCGGRPAAERQLHPRGELLQTKGLQICKATSVPRVVVSSPAGKSLTMIELEPPAIMQKRATSRGPCKTRPDIGRSAFLTACVIGLASPALHAQQAEADEAWSQGRYPA